MYPHVPRMESVLRLGIQLTFRSRATSALNPLNQLTILTILTPFRVRLEELRCHLAVHCRAMHKLRVHWPKAPLISWDYPDTLREYPRPKKRQHMQLLHAGVVRVSLKLQLIVLIFRLDFDKRPALKKVLPVALVHLKRAICSGQTDCLQG